MNYCFFCATTASGSVLPHSYENWRRSRTPAPLSASRTFLSARRGAMPPGPAPCPAPGPTTVRRMTTDQTMTIKWTVPSTRTMMGKWRVTRMMIGARDIPTRKMISTGTPSMGNMDLPALTPAQGL